MRSGHLIGVGAGQQVDEQSSKTTAQALPKG